MVGGDGVDVAALYRFPDGVLRLLTLHRRRAYEVPAVCALVNAAGEFKVLRAGLGVDLIALVLRLCHRLNALLVREVYDVQRCVRSLRQIDGALVRLALHELRTAHVVIPRVGLALADVLLGEGVHQLVVLGVHRDERSELLGLCKELVEHAVLNAEIVYHEHLVGGDSDVAGVLYAVEEVSVDILDADVERIVHRRVRSRQGVPAVKRIGHSLVEILEREVEHRCGAAARRGSCPREVVVGGNRAAERHCKVRVGVYSAREHQLARCVHHLRSGDIRDTADCGNLPVLYRDVSLVRACRTDDCAVSDYHVHIESLLILFWQTCICRKTRRSRSPPGFPTNPRSSGGLPKMKPVYLLMKSHIPGVVRKVPLSPPRQPVSRRSWSSCIPEPDRISDIPELLPAAPCRPRWR